MFEFELRYKGIHAAFDAACAKIREHETALAALYASRFFVKREHENGALQLFPTTENFISNTYDLNDLDGEPIPQFFYCDMDGELYPVTLGRRERTGSEDNFIYASSDLVANGKIVGCVRYTDH